jgi:hypothetical protein
MPRARGAFRGAIPRPRRAVISAPASAENRARKRPAPWRAKWRAEWLPEWRAGANAKSAREGARRPRRGSPAGPVAPASVGGVKLGPWSARGGRVAKAGRARETPRGTAREGTRKGSGERREWRRKRARRAARKGAWVGANPEGLPEPARRHFRAAPAGSRGARWVREGRAERTPTPGALMASDSDTASLARLLLWGPTREVPPSCSDRSPQVLRSPLCW